MSSQAACWLSSSSFDTLHGPCDVSAETVAVAPEFAVPPCSIRLDVFVVDFVGVGIALVVLGLVPFPLSARGASGILVREELTRRTAAQDSRLGRHLLVPTQARQMLGPSAAAGSACRVELSWGTGYNAVTRGHVDFPTTIIPVSTATYAKRATRLFAEAIAAINPAPNSINQEMR